MEVASGADWSIGLNTQSSNSLLDALTLARLGTGLRAIYDDVLEEPLPEPISALVGKLDRETDNAAPET